MFLRRIGIRKDQEGVRNPYPFSIPALAQLEELEFHSPVTFFVGENGSGKSTLLEGIADRCGFHTAGGGRNNQYEVHAAQSALGEYVRLSWLPKVTNGFFLRAESFYQFASHIDELAREDDGQSYLPYGGRSLHEQSHGESFLTLFVNRFGGRAIYLLDEPEAALSPARQLAFLTIMHDLVTSGEAQFIIATHSPILLGFPGADIISFDGAELKRVAYEDTEHYQLTRSFLENPQRYLRELFREDEEE